MTKAMRELLAQLSEAEERARDAIARGSKADAEKAMEEVRELRAKIDFLRELEAREEQEFEPSRPKGEQKDREELKAEYRRVFLKTVRNKRLTADEQSIVRDYQKTFFNVMHEGGVTTDPDGDAGVLVPEDDVKTINELMRQLTNLDEYVTVENVTTLSGKRVLEKDAMFTPFVEIDEYGEVPEITGPQFVTISYTVKKRGGFLPLTRELLEDNDANLLNYINNWLAKKAVATYNSLILPLLQAIPAQDLPDVKAIKKLANVVLEPAFVNRATWLTNQDGFQWLDEQEDTNGRPLLQPDPTQPTQRLLLGRPVRVVENRLWPSTGGKAPLIFGDLRQYIVHFRRMGFELASTREGGEAWRRDSLEMRALMRDDVQVWDDKAAVAGTLTISS